MAHTHLERLSKAELIRELSKLTEATSRSEGSADQDREQLIQELHVQHVELEMQNRELREAQHQLEESRARYADLYDFAPVGYCTFDARGVIQEINLTAATLLGADRGYLIGRPISALEAIVDKPLFRAHLRACSERKERVATELTIAVEGRGPTVVQMVSTPARGADGALTGFRTALVDISDLKHLENKLRFLSEAGERLSLPRDYAETVSAVVRLAVPLLGDLCFIDVLAKDGEVVRLDAAFADPKKEDALSRRVVTAAAGHGWSSPQQQVIASGTPMSQDTLPRPDGVSVEEEDYFGAMRAVGARSVMVVPLRARRRTFGALTFVAAESERRYTTHDLAFAEEVARRAAIALDNVQLYEQAQAATRARENTLAVVSHDLRNPLGVVLMTASHLLPGAQRDAREGKDVNEGRYAKAFASIVRSAESMNRLIDDLLDAANIEAGRLSMEKSRCSAEAVLQDAADAMRGATDRRSVRLDVRAVDKLAVWCDRGRILQVFSNLIGNAAKFTPAGGAISLGAERRGDRVVFEVRDSGPGIPKEQVSRTFERFWQAKKSDRLGIGLGLSIVKGIIEAHDGEVWVESELGHGSAFFFALPDAPA